MAQTVKLKRSAVAAKVPLTSDLALGELAANTCDGVLYTLMNDGTNKVVQVGGQSVSATVIAGTNAQGQGPLTSNVNLVTTTTANPSGVTLPTALLGRKLLVFNRGTNPINVYPATGAQIDALGTNVSIQIPVKGWLEFNATSTTQWYSSFGAFINNGSNIYSSISKAPGSNSENFFAGTCAGSSTGNYNNFIGYCAGALSSGSDCNNFFGKFAGVRTTGDKNNFFGPYAGCSTLGGYSNNFFGDFAGCSNTTGCYNVFLGSGAGFSNLTASNNIAIGNRAGYFNRGDRNVFLGQDTGYLTGRLTYITGTDNTVLGCAAGARLTTGTDNFFVGVSAGSGVTSGSYNIFLGKQAGSCATGINNNFIGAQAGRYSSGGNSNTFIGCKAGRSTSGSYNNFFGADAGYYNSTGSSSNLLGRCAGYLSTTASNVIAIGDRAGYFNQGDRNVFLGQDTGYLTGRLTCITGVDNFITGFGAGASLTTGCRNTFIGVNAGCGATGANCNLIVGWNAGKLNGTGRDNIFLGACTGAATVGGISNVFIGRYAGAYASSSTQNVFIGAYAGSYNNAGGQNVFLGTNAGYCNTTGCSNTFIGFQAGLCNSTGSGNFFDGHTAGFRNTTTSGSIAIGCRAGYWNQGNRNIYLGEYAGYVAGRLNTTTGNDNFVVGCNAGARITTGSKNIIIGCKAGSNADLTGGSNHLFGAYAGYALTSGRYNNFFGLNSGCGVTTGQYNNYFGYLTGQYSNGSGNFFAGRQAGYCSTGSDNLFIGNLSGTDNTSGGCNIGLGWLSARYNTTGTENVFIGSQAGQANTVTGASVAIGCNAGYWNNGASNIYIGNCAGRSATRAACTTGTNNLVVGRQSGINITTGTQNSFLGAYAGCLTTTGSCNVIVGGFTGTGFTTSNNHIFLSDGVGTNRLMFNNSGALGLNGANYGAAGQILTSCGSSLAPVWANPGTVTASNSVLDSITAGFNGTTATFNLTLASVAYTPANAAQLTVVLGGVVQKPGTDFTVSTSTITFTTAPTSGLDCFIIANGGYTSVIDGDKGDITVSGTGTIWTIDANVVTNAKLAQVATSTLKGRVTAATGNVEDLTGTQATTLLDTFTSALKGLAPASGGGTTNFLRADGTWAAPSGSGVSLSANNAFTGANTFTNTTGQIFRQAATQDGILLRGRAGGTTSLTVELVPGTLTASRTLTAPDVSGTIITTGDTGTVTNTMLAGSIANNKLLNSAITVNGSSTSLGGSVTLYAGTTTLQTSSANQALTGISSVTLPGSTSGSVQIIPTAAAGTGTVLTLPATTGTVVTTGDTGTITGTMIASNTVTNSNIAPTTASANGQTKVLVSNAAGTATAWSTNLNLDSIAMQDLGAITGNGWNLIYADGSGGSIELGQTAVPLYSNGLTYFPAGLSILSASTSSADITISSNPGLKLTGTISGTPTDQGVLAQGSLGFTGARVGANFADTQAQYFQVILQNKSSNTNASCDFVVCNDASTDTTNYGNFGINSSTYSGTGVFNQPGTVYLTSSGGPLGLGTTTANDIRFSYNSEATDSLTIGATAATFGKSVLLKAGTATDAPLDFTSGTLLTTPTAGAVEYLDSHFYSTPTTTSGRGFIPSLQTFRLTANGTAIGGTIADFYGANSSINLAATAVYEIRFFAYLQKTTAGTLTWTLTASSAPTLISSILRAGPVTGIAAGAPTTLYTGSRGATTAAFGATGSISNNAFMAYEFQTQVITNLATNFRLRITCSAGTVTPQAGSFYTVTQISPTTGSFA